MLQPPPSHPSPQFFSAAVWHSEPFGHSLSPAQAEPPGGDNSQPHGCTHQGKQNPDLHMQAYTD